MLTESEADLIEYKSSPLAFPVFGRGRLLYTLVDEGINERNVRAMCEFIISACSCEIKIQNPGVDLLIAADWEKGIDNRWAEDFDLPPLVGLSELVSAEDSEDSSKANIIPAQSSPYSPDPVTANDELEKAKSNENEEDESTPKFIGNTLILIGVIIMFITSIRLWITHRMRRIRR